MHLTLKFLGNTDENLIDPIVETITTVTENQKPYNIQLKNLGVFPNKNYIKIIWVGLEDEGQTKKIAEKIDEKLNKIGFKKEKRSFHPHLTLARVKSGKDKNKILQILDENQEKVFQKNKVESIKLKKSELTSKGPVYSTLKKINL